jgi:hypothetical protein
VTRSSDEPDLDAAIEPAGRSSYTCHPAPTCVEACRYLGPFIRRGVWWPISSTDRCC